MNYREEKAPQLFNLFGGYFHNFWPEHYGTWEGVVASIINENPPAVIQKGLAELKVLLEEDFDEETLRKVVARDLGANIYPPGMDMTYREWLLEVEKLLLAGVGEAS